MKLFITCVIFRLSGAESGSDRVDLRVRGGKQQEADRPDRNCFISLMSTITGRRTKSDSWEMGCYSVASYYRISVCLLQLV